MNELQEWYPFIWAVIGVIFCLCLVVLDIMEDEKEFRNQKKSWRLLDKTYKSVLKNPNRIKRKVIS